MCRFIVNFVYLWAVVDIRLPIVPSSLTNNAMEIQSTIQSLNYSLNTTMGKMLERLMIRWRILLQLSIAQNDIHKTRWLMAVDANFIGAYYYPIYLCTPFPRDRLRFCSLIYATNRLVSLSFCWKIDGDLPDMELETQVDFSDVYN